MPGLTSRTLGTVAVVAGALLLLSPAALGAVDLGAPTHSYGVTYVETTGDGYDVSGVPWTADGIDERVLCWGSRSRACHLERTLIGDGIETTTGYSEWTSSPEYEYVVDDRRFYAVEASSDRLWLDEQPVDDVLDDLARPDGELPGHVRDALASGDREFETRDDNLPTARLHQVEEDRYATLSHGGSARSTLDEWLERVEPALPVVGFAVGLWLVLWGQATRMRTVPRR